MKKVGYLILILVTSACNRQEGIVIPEEKPVLVINSTLCVDSVISINLSYSQSISNNSAIIFESNANIELYNKDSLLLETLMYFNNGNYRTTSTVAEKSKIYIIKIITSNNVFWANDSLPEKSEGQISSIDSINFHNNPYFFQIKYSLNDKYPFKNYYGLKIKHCYWEFFTNDSILREEWLDVETIDLILTEDINTKYSKKQLLFTDKYFNKSAINLEFGTSKIINNNQFQSKYLIIYMEQFTYDGYIYYVSLNEHIFYQNDPFSQPINVIGNIKNSYGAFTGQSTIADTLSFKY